MIEAAEITESIEGQIEKFDELRAVGIDENARCFLLKQKSNSGRFEAVTELTGGWYKNWSEYRAQVRLVVATLADNFSDLQAQASYFAYGVPDSDGDVDVYLVEDTERDKVPPDLQKPYWKFYGVRQPGEKFTV